MPGRSSAHIQGAFLATLLGPALLPGSAVADAPSDSANFQWQITGAGRLDYFASSRNFDGRRNLLGATVQAKARAVFSNSLSGVLRVRETRDNFTGTGVWDGEMTEGYLTYKSADAFVTLGKQIVSWGRADGINPTNNLTPRNYVVQLPFEADQLQGLPSLKVDFFPAPDSTLTFFGSTQFQPSQPGPVVPPGLPVTEIRPQAGFRHGRYAFKFDHTGQNFDWSVSYFSGPYLLPVLYPAPSAGAVEMRFPRVEVWGGDFAGTVGNFGLRGEIAIVRPESGSPPGWGLQPYVQWVAGGEIAPSPTTDLTVQLVGRLSAPSTGSVSTDWAALEPARTQNALLLQQGKRRLYGFTTRLTKTWLNDTVSAEIYALVYAAPQNGYIRPLIRYAVNDRTTVSIGAEYYFGSDSSYYGRLRGYGGPFLEIRDSF